MKLVNSNPILLVNNALLDFNIIEYSGLSPKEFSIGRVFGVANISINNHCYGLYKPITSLTMHTFTHIFKPSEITDKILCLFGVVDPKKGNCCFRLESATDYNDPIFDKVTISFCGQLIKK
jgi:hypothetical protein